MPLKAVDTGSLRSIISDVAGGDEHISGTDGELTAPCHRFGDADTAQCKFLLGVDAVHRSSNARENRGSKDSQQSGESTSVDNECTELKRKSRTRLTREQKMEVLKLKRAKVHVPEIARRFSCTERTVYYIARNKQALEKEASSPGYRSAAKSLRPAFFPEVEDKVADLVEEARTHDIPVTRAMVASFGFTVKNYLLSSSHTTPQAKAKLEGFRVSEKWTRNFARRRGLVGGVVDGEAESTESHSDAVVMAKDRDGNSQPVARRVADSASTGSTATDVDSSAVPGSTGETRKVESPASEAEAKGTKAMPSSVGEDPAEKGKVESAVIEGCVAEARKVDFQAAVEGMTGGSRDVDSAAATQKMIETGRVDGSTLVAKGMDKAGGKADPSLAAGSMVEVTSIASRGVEQGMGMAEARNIDSPAVEERSTEARKTTRADSTLDSMRNSPEETGRFPELLPERSSCTGTDEGQQMVRNSEVGISNDESSEPHAEKEEEKGDAPPNGPGSGGARSSGVSLHFDVLVGLAQAGGNVDAILLLQRARESMSGSHSSNRG